MTSEEVFMKKAISIFVVILFSVTLIPPTSFEEDNQFLFKQEVSDSSQNVNLFFLENSSRHLVNFTSSTIYDACGVLSSGKIGCSGTEQIAGINGQTWSVPWGYSAPWHEALDSNDSTFLSVEITEKNFCGIATDHRLYCAGHNNNGQLGTGNNNPSINLLVEPILPFGYQAKQLASLKDSFCVLLFNGDIYCWGTNGGRQVENINVDIINIPTKVTFNSSMFSGNPIFKSISSSNSFYSEGGPVGYSFVTENNSVIYQGCGYSSAVAPQNCYWLHPSERDVNHTFYRYQYPSILINHSIMDAVGQCLLLDNQRVTCAGLNGSWLNRNSSEYFREIQNFGEYITFTNNSLVSKIILSKRGSYCAHLVDKTVECWGKDLYSEQINYPPVKLSQSSNWFELEDIAFLGAAGGLIGPDISSVDSDFFGITNLNTYYFLDTAYGNKSIPFGQYQGLESSNGRAVDAYIWIDAMLEVDPANITFDIETPSGIVFDKSQFPKLTGTPLNATQGYYSFNITINGTSYSGNYYFGFEADLDNDGIVDSLDGDIDGDGILNVLDDCPNEYGVSIYIQAGCSDGDLDGYPDIHDQFPFDNSQHRDSDSDGFGDNVNGTNGDSCSAEYGRSLFGGIFGCWDSDNDGWADSIDQFSNDSSQWNDSDGDGFGDNLFGRNGDFCPNESGTSLINYLGCLDSDSDGYADVIDDFPQNNLIWSDEDGDGVDDDSDTFPFDIGQWADRDGDGYGDNPYGGSTSDAFPDEATQWSDIDGDGYGDNPNGFNADAFIADPTQWSDADGDGFGDNPSGRLADAFTDDSTQWEDQDGDGFGDNQSGNNPDPYLFDFDNDGYNDSIDPFPKFASPGDKDNDGVLDGEDLFPDDFREWADNDGDGEGDNADTDDDNDGWSDQDELRAGSDPFSSSDEPIESFEIIVPGTNVGLGAWDLIGIFGGIPLMAWIGFGFITRNNRAQMFEERLREANSRDELEEIAHKWEYSLMLRMLGPHQGIRLERLRSELDDNFESQNQSLSSIDQRVDQTNLVEEEMANQPKIVPEISTIPPIDAEGIQDDNGYEWTSTQDGKDWYRMSGSSDEWIEFSN